MGRPKPSWGGGSAGAVAAAQGYALVGKIVAVAREPSAPWLAGAEELLALAEADERAYARILKEQGCASVGASVEISYRILELAAEGTQAIGEMAGRVKTTLRADLFTASYLLYAGASSALVNMRTNLAPCPDLKESASLLQRGEMARRQIEAVIRQPGWGG